MHRLSRLPLALALCLSAGLAAAQQTAAPNRQPAQIAPPGPVARYVAAARLLPRGFAAEDPLTVLAAVRLARGVTLRPAIGWQATPDPGPAPDPGPGLPRDPGSADATLVLAMMVEGDEDLELTADELLADPPGRAGGAASQATGLGPDAAQSWTLPFYGAAPAEIGLIGLSGPGLTLRVTDAAGAEICAEAPADPAALCAFTPAENGWFSIELRNGSAAAAGYLLLTN